MTFLWKCWPAVFFVLALATTGLPQILPDVTPLVLEITTVPGATIFIDGVNAGKASSEGLFSTQQIVRGTHVVRVEAHKRRTFTQRITITSGTFRVSAPLAEPLGTLEVYTVPGADVLIEGRVKAKPMLTGGS